MTTLTKMLIIHPINSDKERKAKMKYKIGDVVQCVDEEREEYGFKVGHFYTIMAIDDDLVMLDNLKWWDTYDYPNDFKL